MNNYKFAIIFLLLILLCGCGSNTNWEQYEQYELEPALIKTYSFIEDEQNSIWEYAIGKINKNSSSIDNDGLFYKIEADKYILIDRISSCGGSNNFKDIYNYFYETSNNEKKLYITRCMEIYEYTFNAHQYEKRQLEFDLSKLPSRVKTSYEIVKVFDQDIVFKVGLEENNKTTYKNIKCSLDDLICEIDETLYEETE